MVTREQVAVATRRLARACISGRVPVDKVNAITPLLRLRYGQVRDDVLEDIQERLARVEAQAARPVPALPAPAG